MTEEEYGWHRQLASARRDAFVRGVRYIEEFRRLGVWTGADTYAAAIYPLPEKPKPDPMTCPHDEYAYEYSNSPSVAVRDRFTCRRCGISVSLPPRGLDSFG